MSRTRIGCVLAALWAGRIAASLLSDLWWWASCSCSASGRLIRDDEGVELPDSDAAAQEAALAAADMGSDCELGGRIIPAGTSRCAATGLP